MTDEVLDLSEDGRGIHADTFGLRGETLAVSSSKRSDVSATKDVDRAMLTNLAERHLKLAPTGMPDLAETVMEIAAEEFLDPDLFDREKRAIQDCYPVLAGTSADIANPGDYISIDDLDTPIFVTRTKKGEAKAFVNSCRHRGGGLVYDKRGSGKHLFSCPYHGWTYDSEGKLFGLPCSSAFPGVDKAEYGLIEVPCAEVAGLIFVSPRADVPLDIEAHLGKELIEELSGWGYDRLHGGRSEPIELEGNWKLVYDTFLDTYHFAAAHKANLAAYFNCNVMTVDTFGKHIRMSVSYRTIVDEYPKPPEEERKPLSFLVVAYVLFPGYVLINNPQVLELFRIFPKGVRKTTVQHACYSRLPLDVPENAAMFENVWQSAHNIVQNEDFPFGVTSAQRGLESGSLKKFVFGKNELASQINYQSIRDAISASE